jgi:hypothetical protein
MENQVLIAGIQQKWDDLYKKVREKKITNVEYAQRRKAYENIIAELYREDPKEIPTPFCKCEKPWGVSGSCVICGKTIEIL